MMSMHPKDASFVVQLHFLSLGALGLFNLIVTLPGYIYICFKTFFMLNSDEHKIYSAHKC